MDSLDVFSAVHDLLSKATDVPKAIVKRESTPEDLGIDSLMVTEVLSDMQQAFGIETLPKISLHYRTYKLSAAI